MPAVAQPINGLIVGTPEAYAAALTMIIDAAPDSEDIALVLVGAANTFNGVCASIQDARGQVAQLASDCSVAV